MGYEGMNFCPKNVKFKLVYFTCRNLIKGSPIYITFISFLTIGPDVFSSKNLALQAQKKILSKIASKTVANMLIDDTSSEIFDELYKVTKEHIHNKKEAHKIMKDLIKVSLHQFMHQVLALM